MRGSPEKHGNWECSISFMNAGVDCKFVFPFIISRTLWPHEIVSRKSHTCFSPCKIGTGISQGSHQDSRRSPAEVARFPGRILPGKNSRCVSGQESRREICTRRDPTKKKTLLQDPGENPAGKQNLDSIRGKNLTLAE